MPNSKSMPFLLILLSLPIFLLLPPSLNLQAADHAIQAGIGVEYAQSTRLGLIRSYVMEPDPIWVFCRKTLVLLAS
jgi:hypothetical protein